MYVWFEIGELTPLHSNELAKYMEDIVYAVKKEEDRSPRHKLVLDISIRIIAGPLIIDNHKAL